MNGQNVHPKVTSRQKWLEIGHNQCLRISTSTYNYTGTSPGVLIQGDSHIPTYQGPSLEGVHYTHLRGVDLRITAFSKDIGFLGGLGVCSRCRTSPFLPLPNWLVAALHKMSASAHQNRKLPSLVTKDWSLPENTLCVCGRVPLTRHLLK